jgi:hypothetical protein
MGEWHRDHGVNCNLHVHESGLRAGTGDFSQSSFVHDRRRNAREARAASHRKEIKMRRAGSTRCRHLLRVYDGAPWAVSNSYASCGHVPPYAGVRTRCRSVLCGHSRLSHPYWFLSFVKSRRCWAHPGISRIGTSGNIARSGIICAVLGRNGGRSILPVRHDVVFAECFKRIRHRGLRWVG